MIFVEAESLRAADCQGFYLKSLILDRVKIWLKKKKKGSSMFRQIFGYYHKKAIDKYTHDSPAIYYLCLYRGDKGYKLQYIGEANTLNQRLRQHKDERWWNCFAWENAPASNTRRKDRESELLNKFKPPHNTQISKRERRDDLFNVLSGVFRDIFR